MNVRALKTSLSILSVSLIPAAPLLFPADAAAQEATSTQQAESRLTVELRGEDRDVGLKRMEILERSLSPERSPAEFSPTRRSSARSRESASRTPSGSPPGSKYSILIGRSHSLPRSVALAWKTSKSTQSATIEITGIV